MQLKDSFFIALSTYSRIPAPNVRWTDENRRYALCFFPLIGLAVGGILALWLWVCELLALNAFLRGAIGAAIPLLKAWTVTLAEELAWSRSGKSELPKNVSDRAATVRKNLALIASGKMLLPAAVQDETSGGGSVVGISGNTPVFGRDKMAGY